MIRMLADPVLLEIVGAAGGVGTQLTLEPEALHLMSPLQVNHFLYMERTIYGAFTLEPVCLFNFFYITFFDAQYMNIYVLFVCLFEYFDFPYLSIASLL